MLDLASLARWAGTLTISPWRPSTSRITTGLAATYLFAAAHL
ncbi:hypothetical protein OG612_43360 (plasmid) [Streptomyces sp. NBC_01527]|nr:hypothetical protein OG763_44850 [Streptomyces sp. NBC_01230]